MNLRHSSPIVNQIQIAILYILKGVLLLELLKDFLLDVITTTLFGDLSKTQLSFSEFLRN